MTAFDPQLAARIASSGIPLSADLVQDTDRMTAEREAEILKFRDDCHPTTGILAFARVHDALADLLAELAAVRKERDEARAAAFREAADLVAADTHIHIRYGSATDYAERHAALLRQKAGEVR